MGVDDSMTFVLLMEHFFESQMKVINHGSKRKYLERDETIEQNNTSAIQQLKHNDWKLSSSTQIKYIDVRYYYVTNYLKTMKMKALTKLFTNQQMPCM